VDQERRIRDLGTAASRCEQRAKCDQYAEKASIELISAHPIASTSAGCLVVERLAEQHITEPATENRSGSREKHVVDIARI
jgi:hypothetical protein